MPTVFNVKIAICLIFTAATLACHLSSGRLCVCFPACPDRERMRGVSSYTSKVQTKTEEIRLSINNRLIQFH